MTGHYDRVVLTQPLIRTSVRRRHPSRNMQKQKHIPFQSTPTMHYVLYKYISGY